MENFCKGLCLGMVAGAVVAGTIVAKNKEMAAKIRKGLGVAEEKMQEAKEFIEEKLRKAKANLIAIKLHVSRVVMAVIQRNQTLIRLKMEQIKILVKNLKTSKKN